MTEWISPTRFLEADGVEDWRVLYDGVSAYFATGSFAAGARLALAIGDLDGLGPRQPDVDVRHDGVTVRLVTIGDDQFGLSERDVELAGRSRRSLASSTLRRIPPPFRPSRSRSTRCRIPR
jgi:4a-hydroxytetrahydrobiopterin dehydratase